MTYTTTSSGGDVTYVYQHMVTIDIDGQKVTMPEWIFRALKRLGDQLQAQEAKEIPDDGKGA